jgi:hypothetical protein
MPQLSSTIYQHQYDTIHSMAESSGLKVSQIVRGMLEKAIRSGYTPGSVSFKDLAREAHRGQTETP